MREIYTVCILRNLFVKDAFQVKTLKARESGGLGRAKLMFRMGPRGVQTEIFWTQPHENLLFVSAGVWADVAAIRWWAMGVDGC